jgi:hypothetical protein
MQLSMYEYHCPWNKYQILYGKPEWYKKGLKEAGWEDVEWIYLAQNVDDWQALLDMIMDFWIPYSAEKRLAS